MTASTSSAHDHALAYLRAGFSVVPIADDGTKKPPIKWKDYQSRPMTEEEARREFRPGLGVAIIAGEVSGNTEIIDIDDEPISAEWITMIPPALLDRLPQVRTPSGCLHTYYRVDGVVTGNQKLAERPNPEWHPGSKTSKTITLVETRGQGGYAVAPGSPGACHPSGREWVHESGPPIAETPVITTEEREILISAARSFNEVPEGVAPEPGPAPSPGGALRPGDDWNRRAEWSEILEPHGWTMHPSSNGKGLWARPGKDTRHGWSATTGFCKNERSGDLLYVFSSSASPLEPGRAYSRFATYAALNHGGDFRAAAQALSAAGYGERTRTEGKAEERPIHEGPGGIRIQVQSHQKGARWTSARILVEIDGDKMSFSITDSPTSIDRTAGEIAGYSKADRASVRIFLRKLLGRIAVEEEAPKAPGTSARAVLLREAERLKLSFMDEKERAWSESLGRFLYARQFAERLISGTVIDDLRNTEEFKDAREVTIVSGGKRLAESIWATLCRGLPEQAEAKLGPDSRAAQIARQAILDMLHTPRRKGASLADLSFSSDILDVAQIARTEGKVNTQWRQVSSSFALWWRLDGRELQIAFHVQLLRQTGTIIAGVYDSRTFNAVMERYGIVKGEEVRTGKRQTRARQFLPDILKVCLPPEEDREPGE